MESTVDLVNMMLGDASSSEVSDKIKEILYSKSSEKLDDIKPAIANAMFGNEVPDETEEE